MQALGTLRDGLFIAKVTSPYSPAQVLQWLQCMKYPQAYTEDEILGGTFPLTLENLSLLVTLHLTTFPFENVTMHYAPEHDMDVTYQGAFKRLVLEHNGSYCFGLNGVFLGMLRGLGYRAYAVSARINATRESAPVPTYTTRVHGALLVQPFLGSNQTYLVDVGFSSPGLVRPILLSDAKDNVVVGTTPTEHHRLTRASHPSSSIDLTNATPSRADFEWNLQVQHQKHQGEDDSRWKVIYSFSEREMHQSDAEDFSYIVAQKGRGPLFFNVMVVKYGLLKDLDLADESVRKQISDELGRGEVTEEMKETFMYKYILFGAEVKRSIGGSQVMIRTFKDDLERIRGLREIFGLGVPDGAEAHIRGRIAALSAGERVVNVSAEPPAKRRKDSLQN